MYIIKKHNGWKIFPLLLLLLCLMQPSVIHANETEYPLAESGLPLLPDYQELPEQYSLNRGDYPERYDSRDYQYITPVKNQSPWGACWAFSAISAGETSLIKKGLADSTLDLSELHLAYFFFKCPKDPLGLTKGDSIQNNTGESYLNTGGNNLFSMFALSKWMGPANESLAPYGGNTSYINEAYAYQDVAHLQNVRFVNSKDRNSVKDLILVYGSVSASMYFDSNFHNKNNGAYLVPYKIASTNHAVTLVGWDDNYSKENFSAVYNGTLIKPENNGAWIVKNSYDTSFGDKGYNYISYEDAAFSTAGSDFLCYAYDMEPADNYDHNYQYDGSYSSSYLDLNNESSVANVYKIKGNPNGNERLDAVSFSVLTQNVTYKIQIYKDPPAGNPSGGIPVLKNPIVGTTTYSGYYTIPISEQPVFRQGDSFAVVITFSGVYDSTVGVFTDGNSDMSKLLFISSSAKNQSYCKLAKTNSWQDLHVVSAGKTVRIKAFTTNTTQSATKLELITNTLKKPVIRGLTNYSKNKTKLKWKSVKNASKYEIYRSTEANSGYKKIGTTSKLSFLDKKCATGTTYYYKIRAQRTLNKRPAYSRFSSRKSVIIRPGKPSFTSLKSSGKKSVKLKWKKIAGVDGYEIYRSKSKNKGYGKKQSLTPGHKTTCVDRTPSKGVFYYKIRSYCIKNNKKIYSSFSNVKQVKVR